MYVNYEEGEFALKPLKEASGVSVKLCRVNNKKLLLVSAKPLLKEFKVTLGKGHTS